MSGKDFIVSHDGAKFPGGRGRISGPVLDELLRWCSERKASDITIQTDRPVIVEIGGQLHEVTDRRLTAPEVVDVVNQLYGAASGNSQLLTGRDLDRSYEVQVERGRRLRYRVNATGILSEGHSGAQITIRTLPDVPPLVEALGVEVDILAACRRDQGMALVTGPTGSGKSTLLAAIIRMRAEDPEEHGKILCYEAPIEYTYDMVEARNCVIAQSEIGPAGHLATFADAVRNAMRRKPKIILIGESRDAETMGGSVEAALSGHMLFTTLHTNGVRETVQRMLSVFTADERTARAVSIMQALQVIVTQRLFPRVGGGMVAAREYLVFDDDLRDQFLSRSYEEWPQIARRVMLEGRGQTMGAAVRALHSAGLVGDRVLSVVEAAEGRRREAA